MYPYAILMPLFLVFAINCFSQSMHQYEVATVPWDAGLGNHRAILQVDNPEDAVSLELIWRRHDRAPERKQFIIIGKETGQQVENIHRIHVDNERCQIVFGPIAAAGTYYFYYLPFETQDGHGFYSKSYLKKEAKPSASWVKRNKLNHKNKIKKLPKARCLSIQSRTAFDSFFPMEVIALDKEKEEYIKKYNRPFYLFSEDRKYPVRMKDEIPQRWISRLQPAQFSGEAMKNEYYVFQIAVWAATPDINNVSVEFGSLKNGDLELPASSFTCFNTYGVDPYGKPFKKTVNVPIGKVQAFWIGIDLPESVLSGTYRGMVRIVTENNLEEEVEVELKVRDEVIVDRGDSELWRHSRLRWLNSTAGINDLNVPPYKPIEFLGGRTYGLSDKELTLGSKGLTSSIKAYGNEILSAPIAFEVETRSGVEEFSDTQNQKLLKFESGIASGAWQQTSTHFDLEGSGMVESDGCLKYTIKLRSKSDVEVEDIRLVIPFQKHIAEYMMGMGLPGQKHQNLINPNGKGRRIHFGLATRKEDCIANCWGQTIPVRYSICTIQIRLNLGIIRERGDLEFKLQSSQSRQLFLVVNGI